MKNQKGYTLVWALAIILLMGLVLVTVITAVLGMSARSSGLRVQKQAYFTAVSALNLIGAELTENRNGLRLELLDALPEVGGSIAKFTSPKLDDVLGKSAVTAKRDGAFLTLTAEGTLADRSETLSLVLRRSDTPLYGAGLRGAGLTADSRLTTMNGTDVYLPEGGDYQFTEPVTVGGNLLCAGKDDLVIPSGSHIHGKLVADCDVTVESGATVGPQGGGDPCADVDPEVLSGIYTTGDVKIEAGARVKGSATGAHVTNNGTVTGSVNERGGLKSRLAGTVFFQPASGSGAVDAAWPGSTGAADEVVTLGDSTKPDKTTRYVLGGSPEDNRAAEGEGEPEPDTVVDAGVLTPAPEMGRTAVFIYVKEGAKLSIAGAEMLTGLKDAAAGELEDAPTIFLIVEKGGTLAITGDTPVNAYICGAGTVELPELPLTVNGCLSVGTITPSAIAGTPPELTVNYISPYGGDHDAPDTHDKWLVYRYGDKDTPPGK